MIDEYVKKLKDGEKKEANLWAEKLEKLRDEKRNVMKEIQNNADKIWKKNWRSIQFVNYPTS